MLSSRLSRQCAVLLLIAAALAPVGCKAKSAESGSPAGGASVVTSSTLATGAGVATGTSSPGGSTGSTQSGSKITASEAAALDAELEAIQKELDRLSVPGDSDFGGIESGLK